MKIEIEKYKRDIKKQEDKLKEISKKYEESIETKKKEINNIIKNSSDKLKEKEEEMKRNAELKKVQHEEEKKRLNLIYNKNIEYLKKQHEIEKNKQKKEEILKEEQKLIELNLKKEKANKSFNRSKNHMLRVKINSIFDEFEKKGKDFGINEISEFWENNISDMIEKIFESEDLFTSIMYHLKLGINQYKKNKEY